MGNPDETVSLAPLHALDADVVPGYFRSRLASRRREREAVKMEIFERGFDLIFFGGCGTLLILAALAVMAAQPLVAFVVALGAAALGTLSLRAIWSAGERLGFLIGTRDERTYLPPRCREFASEETRILAAAMKLNVDVATWNDALPLLKEHGTPRLREAAEETRRRLESKRRAIVDAGARAFIAAASSEDPSPKALPPAERP